MNDSKIKSEQQVLFYSILPQLPEEVESLLCFFADGGDVIVPFEVIADMGSEEFELICEGYGLARNC